MGVSNSCRTIDCHNIIWDQDWKHVRFTIFRMWFFTLWLFCLELSIQLFMSNMCQCVVCPCIVCLNQNRSVNFCIGDNDSDQVEIAVCTGSSAHCILVSDHDDFHSFVLLYWSGFHFEFLTPCNCNYVIMEYKNANEFNSPRA